jgi:microcystin-dependent protein
MSGSQIYPNSNTYVNHSITPPPLSVCAYFYPYNSSDSTKGDPNGWVICDGITRTVADGRFSIVAPLLNTVMGVTTNNANSITPPNLKGRFVYGSTNPTSINNTGGSENITLSTNNLPSHNHSINDPGHNHVITDAGHVHGVSDPNHGHSISDPGHSHSFQLGYWAARGGQNPQVDSPQPGSGYYGRRTQGSGTGISINGNATGITINSATTGFSLNSTTPSITTNNAGSGSSFSILPPYITINYIMKI